MSRKSRTTVATAWAAGPDVRVNQPLREEDVDGLLKSTSCRVTVARISPVGGRGEDGAGRERSTPRLCRVSKVGHD